MQMNLKKGQSYSKVLKQAEVLPSDEHLNAC